MRIHTFIFALALIATGCGGRDAKLRQQIVGTWSVTPSERITFLADGSYHDTHSQVDTTEILAFDGPWTIRDGFLIMTITNSIATNPYEKLTIGQTYRHKIRFVDEHNLDFGDGKRGASFHR
jgi:hypothetical protein